MLEYLKGIVHGMILGACVAALGFSGRAHADTLEDCFKPDAEPVVILAVGGLCYPTSVPGIVIVYVPTDRYGSGTWYTLMYNETLGVGALKEGAPI